MKRKYIIPQMIVEAFSASSNLLGGSKEGGGGYEAGNNTDTGKSTSGGISGSGGSGLIQHSKQFDAWESWDE